MKVGAELGEDGLILVSLSGRGDKDVHTAARWFGLIDEDETVVSGEDEETKL